MFLQQRDTPHVSVFNGYYKEILLLLLFFTSRCYITLAARAQWTTPAAAIVAVELLLSHMREPHTMKKHVQQRCSTETVETLYSLFSRLSPMLLHLLQRLLFLCCVSTIPYLLSRLICLAEKSCWCPRICVAAVC